MVLALLWFVILLLVTTMLVVDIQVNPPVTPGHGFNLMIASSVLTIGWIIWLRLTGVI